MIQYPTIDPVIFAIGPLQVRWYGLMYVIGFCATYLLVAYQTKLFKWERLQRFQDNLNLSLILGVLLGGRLGYVCFYNLSYYLDHPAEIFATWQGGMSFHGGALGALLAGVVYCHRVKLDFWRAADLYTVTIPIGLFFGRLGNFINGELFGRQTAVAWAMIFPGGGQLSRHPSQLYEAALEGVGLFIILWAIKSKPWQRSSSCIWPHGVILALFLILYGSFRFIIEFLREPDPQLGLVVFSLTMGQCLCLGMICLGLLLWVWRARALSQQQR